MDKTSKKNVIQICVVAGEASGDLQASLLVSSIRKEYEKLNTKVQFWGSVGPHLRAENVEEIIRVEEISVMGLSEIIPKYLVISKAYKTILHEIERRRPNAVIFIDYPGFNLKLMEDVYNLGLTTIYHIPPKVWSHGIHRAKKLLNKCYLITSILPFEEDFFEKLDNMIHLNAKHKVVEFIGNPLKDKIDDYLSRNTAQREPFKIGLLPGSREGEIKKCLPILIEAFVELEKAENKVFAHIPIAPTLSRQFIQKIISEIKLKLNLSNEWFDSKIKLEFGKVYEILSTCDYAWVCSGTATLEAAFFQTPMSVMYKSSFITGIFFRLIIKVKYVSLVNLCSNKETIPEFLQEKATPKNLIEHALFMLKNKDAKQKMVRELQKVSDLFPSNASQNASQKIVDCIEKYNLPPSLKFRFFTKRLVE